MLSIIIPVLNEEETIRACLTRLQPLRNRHVEIIVVDGGSVDQTVVLAGALADWVIEAQPGRARQMNAGAQKARGEQLLFLHADTVLPEEAMVEIARALYEDNHRWGRFDVQFDTPVWILPIVGFMMNWRSRRTGIATGDQAIFVQRAAFEQIGGFPDIALMEDIALSKSLKRLGPPACLRSRVTTSGRRWETNGAFKTIALMWRLRLAYFLGAEPADLAKRYGHALRTS